MNSQETIEEQETRILEKVKNRSPVSIYNLIDAFEKEKIEAQEIVSSVYYLVGRKLLHIEIRNEGYGSEAIVSTTSLTDVHLKRKGR